uniref:Tripartite motif-containing protein 16-like n=1 Tax=Salmo trutta TaxID=8032 RepID=A0A673X7J3_SALTR
LSDWLLEGRSGGRRVEQGQAVFYTCLSRRGDKAWWTWRAGWQCSDSKRCRGYCTYCFSHCLCLCLPLSLSVSLFLSLCLSLSLSLSVSLCLSLSQQRSAQAAVEDSDQIFTELIRSIERRRSEVKELIRAQEKAQVSQAEGLLEQLKQEIAELRKRSTELEQLSHTEDHIHFLQSYQSLSSISVSSDLPSIVVRPLQYFGDVSKTVSELREKLEDFLKGEWTKISTTVNIVDVLLPPEPKTREELLQYSCQITLDQNTAHIRLSLSKGNRKVTFTDQVQPYPDHPDRFTNWCQVLCRGGLSGRCYWEVEWTGDVYTAVSYEDISRTETDSVFGYNDKSWSLQHYRVGYCFRHNNVVTKVSGPQSSRVGVYLDHKAGTLSFYSVSDTMTLLHRVQTTFTQPLYPGFYLYGTAELVKL